MEIIPLIYEHCSKKSTLTYWNPEETTENGPSSIIKLCLDNKIDKIVGVFTRYHSFLEAYKNCKKHKIHLVGGLEFWITDDVKGKENAEKNESKIIVLLNNTDAYFDIIKLYSHIYTDKENKYYKFRYDWPRLKQEWSNNYTLLLPFFDSFIHKNSLTFSKILPELPTDNIIIAREIDSQLPFAPLIDKALDEFNKDKKYQEINTKTIYYKDSSDIKLKSWEIFRCLENRAEFSNPELDWMCSKTFSFDNFLKLKNT